MILLFAETGDHGDDRSRRRYPQCSLRCDLRLGGILAVGIGINPVVHDADLRHGQTQKACQVGELPVADSEVPVCESTQHALGDAIAPSDVPDVTCVVTPRDRERDACDARSDAPEHVRAEALCHDDVGPPGPHDADQANESHRKVHAAVRSVAEH